jgi:hypothetical protein
MHIISLFERSIIRNALGLLRVVGGDRVSCFLDIIYIYIFLHVESVDPKSLGVCSSPGCFFVFD